MATVGPAVSQVERAHERVESDAERPGVAQAAKAGFAGAGPGVAGLGPRSQVNGAALFPGMTAGRAVVTEAGHAVHLAADLSLPEARQREQAAQTELVIEGDGAPEVGAAAQTHEAGVPPAGEEPRRAAGQLVIRHVRTQAAPGQE